MSKGSIVIRFPRKETLVASLIQKRIEKKAREGSSTTSSNDAAENEKVFQQVSTTNDISEVLEYVKTLEVKISEIYNFSNDTKSMQVKSDKQLADLTQSVKLMSENFDEFEKDRKVKEKIINSLKQEVNGVNERVKSIEKVSDDHEQYSRRNCLLIHGIEEDKDEVIDDIVVNMLQDKLELGISKKDIDRSHRIRKPSPTKKRPIIVKFVPYNDRHKAYSNKKRLKDSRISITGSLTGCRMGQLNKARDEHGF